MIEPDKASAKRPRPKRRLQRWLLYYLGVPFAWALMRLISATWRKHRVGHEATAARPIIFALWHGDLAVGTTELPRLLPNIDVLISKSRDGDIVARLAAMFGANVIRGGSSKGATGALLSMRRRLANGHAIINLVDGPRGPFASVKPGVIAIASAGGAPIIPCAALADRAWRFRSWDRASFPKPFARVKLIYGPPLTVPRHADRETIEAMRQELERRMLELHKAENGMIGALDGPAGREKIKRPADGSRANPESIKGDIGR